jgi:integrase
MVKPRGTSFQAAVRWAGKNIRRSFPDKAAALAWEAEALARIARGEPPEDVAAGEPGGAWTLTSLLDAVTNRFWKGTANEDKAVANAEEVIEILGAHRRPSEITPLDIDALVGELRKRGNADSTVNRKLAALGKLLSFAQSRGIIKAKPRIERQREKQGRLRYLTIEEERRILQHIANAGDTDFHDLVVFLVDVGCRIGEACRMKWSDVDDVYVRFFRTKSGKNRAVPQTARVRAILGRRALARGEGPFMKWSPNTATKRWSDYRKEVGLSDTEAVLHSLRHTCASRLVQAGTPIQVVQQWLGHETLQMTLRYAHLAPCNLLDAVKVLDRAAQQQEQPDGEQRIARQA